ncbi:MAG TPA: PepSY-associated TM helix domain-containing protein [Granulicella sp.]
MDAVTGTETLRAAKRSRASWLRSPQRVFLRRAIFQVHLWSGILLAIYSVIIGLTGSALVFKEEIARTIQPGLYHVAPGPQQITLDEAVRRVQSARPGWAVFAMEDFAQPELATTVLMRSTTAKPTPNYRMVSFDPHTGQVLFDRLRYAGFMGWLSNLHVYLLSGEAGLLVSGWMGVGLLLLCLSGLILWWPGVQRWAAALVINSRASWRRLNWDLHTVIGFWACVALMVVTFTGVDFAFPGPVGNLIEVVTGGSLSAKAATPNVSNKPLLSSTTPIITIDQAIAAAYRALPKDAPPGYLQLPARAGSPYKVTGYYTGVAPYSQLVRISLDPHTGALLALNDTRQQTRGQRIEQYFVAVHFGSFGGKGVFGTLVKVVWVLLGIVPALLAVTGLVMYWNRKLRPVWRRMTKATNAVTET